MRTRYRIAVTGLRSFTLLVLLTMLHPAVAEAEPLFDEHKRVILPSEAATTILKWYVADDKWSTTEWPVTSENLDLLEVALASAYRKLASDRCPSRLRLFIASTCQRNGRAFT
jgi:hypothetical protein